MTVLCNHDRYLLSVSWTLLLSRLPFMTPLTSTFDDYHDHEGDLPIVNMVFRQFLIIPAVVFVTELSSHDGSCPSNKFTAHDFSCRVIGHLVDVTKTSVFVAVSCQKRELFHSSSCLVYVVQASLHRTVNIAIMLVPT